MLKQIFVGFVCVLFAAQLNGQFTLSGKVIDEKNVILEGASIVVEQENEGAISDGNGYFEITNISIGLNLIVTLATLTVWIIVIAIPIRDSTNR